MHHHVILTSRCMNSCKFCATGNLDHTLDKENVIEFLDIHKGDTVLLTGGEPTLHRDFIDIARYVKECGGSVDILTNSIRFADPVFCDKAAPYIDSAQCSFYSWSENITAYLTGNRKAYDLTSAGINNLLDSSVDVDIKTLVNLRPCYRTLDTTVDTIIHEFDPTNVWISGCDFVGTLQTNHGLIVPLQQCVPYIDRAVDIATTNNVTIELMYIPLCMMSGRSRQLVISHPGGSTIDAYMSGDTSAHPGGYDCAYVAECYKCRWKDRCSGVWTKYLNMYNGGNL